MSATEAKGMALVTSASAEIGPIYAAAKVASRPAAHAESGLVSGPILPALLRLTLPNLAAMLVLALSGDLQEPSMWASSEPRRWRPSRWSFR
jgi:hypothetical protein